MISTNELPLTNRQALFANLLNIGLLISSLLATGAIAINLILVYGPAIWRPVIACDKAVVNVGAIIDTDVEQDFILRNAGGRPLTISRIRPDCRCSKFEPKEFPQMIEPGKSLLISCHINLQGLSGVFEKRLKVFSDDPLHPQFKLIVKGEAGATPPPGKEVDSAVH